jgi:Tetratricopeptide repeat
MTEAVDEQVFHRPSREEITSGSSNGQGGERCGVCGEALRDLGHLHRAHQLHEQALAGYRRTRGDDHIYTLHAMTNLAVTLTQLGDLPGARDLHERALPAADSCSAMTTQRRSIR